MDYEKNTNVEVDKSTEIDTHKIAKKIIGKPGHKNSTEIIFSKCVRSGLRIYYFDAKRNKDGQMYLSITESKKQINNTADTSEGPQFEKHKIFLFEEDFGDFFEAIKMVADFIQEHAPDAHKSGATMEHKVTDHRPE